jgi:hypothetical protein
MGGAAHRRAFEQPLVLHDQTVDMGAFGIACWPQHAADADTLLNRAEVAMYAAKRKTSGVLVYDPAHRLGQRADAVAAVELRQAVERNELRLFLQPKMALGTARWSAPRRWCAGSIRRAAWCRRCSSSLRRADRLHAPADAVDVRGRARLARPAGAGRAARVGQPVHARPAGPGAAGSGCSASCSATACRPRPSAWRSPRARSWTTRSAPLETLKRLSEQRLQAVDRRLRHRLLVAGLPEAICRSRAEDRQELRDGMESDADDAKIVRSTIDLAHNLGLTVVAEGVETPRPGTCCATCAATRRRVTTWASRCRPDERGRMSITVVTLRPAVRFAGDKRPDAAEITRLHHVAHEECFIANSVRSEVRCEPVTLES